MKVAVLIASRNRPDLVERLVGWLRTSVEVPHDVYVVECGSEREKLSLHATLWYPDPDFKGKCHGHALLLEQARASGRYDAFWVLMNDLEFEPGVDALRPLVETLEREPRLALVSPTAEDGLYPGSARRPGGGFRKVTTVDYLGFLIRARAVDEVGFLDPAFRWCWGAIHELSYHLYRAGWFVAYSDEVAYRHLGGSTYGVPGTATVSRETYQREAKRHAWRLLRERYGPSWPRTFLAATAGHELEIDTFALHDALWAEGYTPAERAALERELGRELDELETRGCDERALRLHLGCGSEYREGWINVDLDPEARVDLRCDVTRLDSLADGSVDLIEANHLFEHLPLGAAPRALAEWRRVLKPGGELALELPDVEACARLLGRHFDEQGIDLALGGLYGWPADVERRGEALLHRWGWTRAALAAALRTAGFEDVTFGPIAQRWRPAARIGRDLRVVARRPAPVAAPLPERVEQPAPLEPEPWPLATEAATRVLAWPDWRSEAELEQLFALARPLAGRADACLVLRLDPKLDPAAEEAAARLERAFERVLGPRCDLAVLLVEDELRGSDWRRLGAAVGGVLLLPSSSTSPRAGALARTRARTLAGEAELRLLCEPTPRAAPGAPGASSVDWRLVESIGELNPWSRPVVIENLQVHPGRGGPRPEERLVLESKSLARLLVERGAGLLAEEGVEARGLSLLDLGCDCGWFAAQWVERGVARVLGVDPDPRRLRQAELVLARGARLAPESRTLLQGRLDDPATFERLVRLGPHDVVLCAEAALSTARPEELLGRAAALAERLLVAQLPPARAEELAQDLGSCGLRCRLVREDGQVVLLARPAPVPAQARGA